MNIQIDKEHHQLLADLKKLTGLSIQAVSQVAIEVLWENKNYIPDYLQKKIKGEN